MMQLFLSPLTSPIGSMLLVADEAGRIRALEFSDHKVRLHRNLRERHADYTLTDVAASLEVVDAFRRYFSGELHALDSLPIEPEGTAFQQQVWSALRNIPVGTTVNYGSLARMLGLDDPRAAIDVGAANGANPIAIVIPCHRVIASNGDLKGYAWGLHRKRWLLEHEHAIEAPAVEPKTAMLPGF